MNRTPSSKTFSRATSSRHARKSSAPSRSSSVSRRKITRWRGRLVIPQTGRCLAPISALQIGARAPRTSQTSHPPPRPQPSCGALSEAVTKPASLLTIFRLASTSAAALNLTTSRHTLWWRSRRRRSLTTRRKSLGWWRKGPTSRSEMIEVGADKFCQF